MNSGPNQVISLSMLLGFAAIVDGKNEEMSTSELSGGARIHHIFQNIFVRSLDVSSYHVLLLLFGIVCYITSTSKFPHFSKHSLKNMCRM